MQQLSDSSKKVLEHRRTKPLRLEEGEGESRSGASRWRSPALPDVLDRRKEGVGVRKRRWRHLFWRGLAVTRRCDVVEVGKKAEENRDGGARGGESAHEECPAAVQLSSVLHLMSQMMRESWRERR